MGQVENASVYRICGVTEGRWDVLQGSSTEPVATFNDKHTALAYAMTLARGDSQLPLSRRQDVWRNALALSTHARGPSL